MTSLTPLAAAASTDPHRSGLDHVQSLQLLSQQTTILEMLAAGTDLPAVLTAVVRALEAHLPGTWCSVLLYDAENGQMWHGAAPSLPPDYNAAIDGMAVGERSGSCGTAAYLNSTVVVQRIATDPRWEGYRDLAARHGLAACWSSPIHGRDGAVVATFAVYHPVPHVPDPREERLVERYRHLASIAISHSRLWGALAESEEEFRRAFEDSAVGMARLDLDGRFVRVNAAMCTLTGRRECDLLGRHFDDVTHPGDVAASTQLFADLVSGRRNNGRLEKRYLRPDGTLVWGDMTASVVRSADGRPLHISTNVGDLSGRKAAEQERRARRDAELARSAAEAASKAKSDFLSTMSHELRTPLSAIVGFTELLDTLELEGDRRRTALGHIDRAARHIIAILDDVLDLAKIEAGAVTIEATPVRVAAAVQQTLELLEPLAAERGLVVDASAVDPRAAVLADARRLRQILLNVLSNGIKYNRVGGTLSITVKPASGAGPDRRVSIEVRDTGEGIAEQVRSRLFTPFDRLGAEHREPSGSGLGLVVTDRLVAAMGGTLVLDSREGLGTTVTISFPALAATTTAPTASWAEHPGPAPETEDLPAATGDVLYVEDDPGHRDLVAQVLARRPGIRLSSCATGREALDRLTGELASTPDLVLLDLDLPDLCGEDILDHLAATPGLAALPVCVLSGRPPRGYPDLPHVAKPLEAARLLRVLDQLLADAPPADAPPTDAPPSPAAGPG